MAHINTRQTYKDKDGEQRPFKDGKPRYYLKYMENGKHRTEMFRRKADAESRRKTVEANEMAGLVSDPKGGETIFGSYAENWIEVRRVKGEPLTLATRQGYKALMRRHLTPEFRRDEAAPDY